MMTILYSLLLLLQASQTNPAAENSATPPPSTPPPVCVTEAHDVFDFWVGNWEVVLGGTERVVAKSTIERVSSGCVIREHWQPLSGQDGVSMSFLNSTTNRWEQLWVGSDGKRVEFAGGMHGGKMVLTGFWAGAGPNGSDALVRMTYTTLEDGSVRQFGEASTDQGISWQSSFDLIYRRVGDS